MRVIGKIAVLSLLCSSLSTVPGEAATLEVAYSSLERIIVQRVMKEGGRYYMEGDASSTCSYAFIQEPRVKAQGGRLSITVLFAGRAGKEVAGKCVGPGDNFDLEVSGIPTFSNGELFLDDMKIRAPDTAYFKIVAPLIELSLQRDLRYPVKQSLEHGAANATAWGYGTLIWDAARVDSVSVGEQSVKLSFDFDLSLKP